MRVRGDDESAILLRYPGLRSGAHEEQEAALTRVYMDTIGSDVAPLLAIAPVLLHLAAVCADEIRETALRAWARIVGGRARSSDLDGLEALLYESRAFGRDLRNDVAYAAAHLANHGTDSVLRIFAESPDLQVREAVARTLSVCLEKEIPVYYELAMALSRDVESSVRVAVIRVLLSFKEDLAVVQRALELIESDPSLEVRADAFGVIKNAHQLGLLERLLALYQAHLSSPSSEIRAAVAFCVSSLPFDPRVAPMVETLLADPDPEVRRSMAVSGDGMTQHPGLAPLFRRAAEHDPDEQVRAAAAGGMRGFLSPEEAVAYARARLAAEPTSIMAWSAFWVAREHMKLPCAQDLLRELGNSEYTIAYSARGTLLLV